MTTKKLPKCRPLGSSGLMVTEVCLGTMTFGIQNTEEDAHAQLDYAVKERGVNFIDTAEMYPVPSSAIPGDFGARIRVALSARVLRPLFIPS